MYSFLNCSSDLQECLQAEIDEILKYKWYLGIEMQRDPLEIMSLNEICDQWIQKHAKTFREYWTQRDIQFSGRD